MCRLLCRWQQWARTFWSEERSDEQRKVLAAAPADRSRSIRFMVFHRCHASQFNLVPTSIVVSDVFFNRCDQTGFIRKLAKIIHLGLQNAPPAFHWAVVNASPDTGHTLYHSGIDKFLMEYFAGILKSSVTVENRMSVRIQPNGFIKC